MTKRWQGSAVRNIEFISEPCILCLYFFVGPVQIQCPALYITQALLLQFPCQNIKLYFLLPLKWSVILVFSPHPFAYFLILSNLLQTPKNSNSRKLELFSISLEGSSYWESTVYFQHLMWMMQSPKSGQLFFHIITSGCLLGSVQKVLVGDDLSVC